MEVLSNSMLMASKRKKFTFSAGGVGAVQDVARSAYTFPSAIYGLPASVTRRVVVLLFGKATANRTFVSATIGGIPAVLHVENQATSGQPWTAIVSATVPEGVAGDVVVTMSGSMSRMGCEVWSLDNETAPGLHWSGSTRSTPPSVASSIPAGGLGLFVASMNTSQASQTWTNAIGSADDLTNNRMQTAYRVAASAETGIVVSITVAGGAPAVLCGASFG